MEMNLDKAKVLRISRQPAAIQIMKDQKEPEYVEYFSYLGTMITNDASCMREIKSRIAMAKTAFNKRKNLFVSQLDKNLRNKLVKCYIWSIALYSAENRILRKVDQNYLESCEMWWWKNMEKKNKPIV
jgi:hypothetical protein